MYISCEINKTEVCETFVFFCFANYQNFCSILIKRRLFENSVAPIAVYKMFKILTSKKKNQTKHEKENSFFNPDGNL